ncbi:hypothetical protein Ancab_020575 [Ancistrocladus abbreviatus]
MSRVTVTLGRNGPVVKRGGPPLSDDDYSDSVPVGGSKQSVRDRLGGTFDNSFGNGIQHSKRQRLGSDRTSVDTNSLYDVRLGKDDLRFKLMQKNMFKKTQNDTPQSSIDLRDRLSSRDIRPGADRKAIPSSETKTIQQPEATFHARQSLAQPRDSSILRQIPSSRSAGDLAVMDPSRTSYSSWTLDGLRQRSPDRILRSSTSRGLSPERNMEELQRRSLMRVYGDGRSNPYMRNNVLSPPRSVSSAAFLPKSAVPPAPAKPVPPFVPQFPHASGIAPKIPYMGDEHAAVESLLQSLGLEKYAINFKAEEVDMHALRQMGDSDLKELGIPMGPRKKILQAVMARPRRNP